MMLAHIKAAMAGTGTLGNSTLPEKNSTTGPVDLASMMDMAARIFPRETGWTRKQQTPEMHHYRLKSAAEKRERRQARNLAVMARNEK